MSDELRIGTDAISENVTVPETFSVTVPKNGQKLKRQRGKRAKVGEVRIKTVIDNKGGSRVIRQFNRIKTTEGWKPYSQFIWRQHFGSIPPGKYIAHKDGNSLNDSIDNLRLISRGDILFERVTQNAKAESLRKKQQSRGLSRFIGSFERSRIAIVGCNDDWYPVDITRRWLILDCDGDLRDLGARWGATGLKRGVPNQTHGDLTFIRGIDIDQRSWSGFLRVFPDDYRKIIESENPKKYANRSGNKPLKVMARSLVESHCLAEQESRRQGLMNLLMGMAEVGHSIR